jgi:hypothetical protein
MDRARLIVCESSPTWVVPLRRSLADQPCRVFETRSRQECWTELQASPASVVYWELVPRSAGATLEALHDQRREFPDSCAIVLVARPAAHYRWLALEAGAHAAIGSPREIRMAITVGLRHLARWPAEPRSWPEELAARLPWSSVAS